MLMFDEYQSYSLGTIIKNPDDPIQFFTLGLCGETGEVAEKVKKHIRGDEDHQGYEWRQALAYELGDVLWYLSNLAASLGYSLSDIAGMNKQKLDDRRARGVSHGSGDKR